MLIGIGLWVFFGALSSYPLQAVAADIFFVVMGIRIFQNAKPEYTIQIGSASGEVRAYTSTNKAQIEAMMAAINEAIVKKG